MDKRNPSENLQQVVLRGSPPSCRETEALMIDLLELGSEFFEGLTAIDLAIVEQAAQQPCRDCGGRLYRGDYPRKPRGGQIAAAAEGWVRRFSLCCGSEGCRRRATP